MFKIVGEDYLTEGTEEYTTYQEAVKWLSEQADSDHYTWLIDNNSMELVRMSDEDYEIHTKSKLEFESRKLEKYLAETDYVITKINEATVLDEDVDTLKTKYADILANRKAARARINEIEELLK